MAPNREQSSHDWNLKSIAELASDKRNSIAIGPFGSDLVREDYRDQGVPVVFVRDVRRQSFKWVSNVFVEPEKAAKLKAHRVKPGDVVVTKMGLPPGISARYPDSMPPGVITADIIRIMPDKESVDSEFLTALLNSTFVQRQVFQRTAGQTRPKLTLQDYKTIHVYLPSMQEQHRIASILSTWDKAIATTERLLENSQKQKRALMQRLLTSRARLNGSGRAWTKVTIRQMGTVLSGGTPDTTKQQYWDGGIPWATPTDITALNDDRFISSTARTITDMGLKHSSATLVPANSLIVCTRATVGWLAINTVPMATNQGFKNLIPNGSFDSTFLFYLFLHNRTVFQRYANGSTFLELSKKDFEKLQFACPELSEQRKISETLVGAEQLVRSFRRLLATLRSQKNALMQQLLSGARRVSFEKNKSDLPHRLGGSPL